jgi:disulfide bond formation protein DsbB
MGTYGSSPSEDAVEQTAQQAAAEDEDPPRQTSTYETWHGRVHGRYKAHGEVPPTRPLDPIRPYIAPRTGRRRRSDWPVLVFALIVWCLIMAGCCIAGFAIYTAYGH